VFVTGRLALAVAVGIVPLVLAGLADFPPYAALGIWVLLCVLLIVVDVLLAPSPRSVVVTRRVPTRTRIGEQVPVSVALQNQGPRTLHALIRDAWQPTAGAGEARQRLSVPPGERRRVSIPLLPRRRGELASEFVMIRSLGPLGLAGRQARHLVRGTIRVLPAFSSRKHLPSRLARLRELDGNTSIQVRGQGTEFDSLREYVRGDDVRSIDWRATARAGTTMLRTWRPERDRHVVIIIDTGRTAAARVGDGTRVDAALEASLLLAALAARAGDHVHLLMYDRVVRARVTGVEGTALLPALTDAMAPVHARLVDTDWPSVAHRGAHRSGCGRVGSRIPRCVPRREQVDIDPRRFGHRRRHRGSHDAARISGGDLPRCSGRTHDARRGERGRRGAPRGRRGDRR